MNPYPHKFDVKISISEYIEQYQNLSDGEHLTDLEVKLAGLYWFIHSTVHLLVDLYVLTKNNAFSGRIMNKRSSSLKLFFYDLYGGGVKVQVMADARFYQFLQYDFLVFDNKFRYQSK